MSDYSHRDVQLNPCFLLKKATNKSHSSNFPRTNAHGMIIPLTRIVLVNLTPPAISEADFFITELCLVINVLYRSRTKPCKCRGSRSQAVWYAQYVALSDGQSRYATINNASSSMFSKLIEMFIITAGAIDIDKIKSADASQEWGNNDGGSLKYSFGSNYGGAPSGDTGSHL